MYSAAKYLIEQIFLSLFVQKQYAGHFFKYLLKHSQWHETESFLKRFGENIFLADTFYL